jgi:hypothetical protein
MLAGLVMIARPFVCWTMTMRAKHHIFADCRIERREVGNSFKNGCGLKADGMRVTGGSQDLQQKRGDKKKMAGHDR